MNSEGIRGIGKTLVIAVGSAGIQIIRYLAQHHFSMLERWEELGVEGKYHSEFMQESVSFVGIDTFKNPIEAVKHQLRRYIEKYPANISLKLVGEKITKGNGCGANIPLGQRVFDEKGNAEEMKELAKLMEGYATIIVPAGLAGGTGLVGQRWLVEKALDMGKQILAIPIRPSVADGDVSDTRFRHIIRPYYLDRLDELGVPVAEILGEKAYEEEKDEQEAYDDLLREVAKGVHGWVSAFSNPSVITDLNDIARTIRTEAGKKMRLRLGSADLKETSKEAIRESIQVCWENPCFSFNDDEMGEAHMVLRGNYTNFELRNIRVAALERGKNNPYFNLMVSKCPAPEKSIHIIFSNNRGDTDLSSFINNNGNGNSPDEVQKVIEPIGPESAPVRPLYGNGSPAVKKAAANRSAAVAGNTGKKTRHLGTLDTQDCTLRNPDGTISTLLEPEIEHEPRTVPVREKRNKGGLWHVFIDFLTLRLT